MMAAMAGYFDLLRRGPFGRDCEGNHSPLHPREPLAKPRWRTTNSIGPERIQRRGSRLWFDGLATANQGQAIP